ncbi:hypothetical protein Cal7507_2921 [Calothrix sp. PCC 7507]|nr:hypothetical protein Cal7507_2921 [Calothrix sp. PCC 7507]
MGKKAFQTILSFFKKNYESYIKSLIFNYTLSEADGKIWLNFILLSNKYESF